MLLNPEPSYLFITAVQGNSSNQGLCHDQEPQLKLVKHPPKPG